MVVDECSDGYTIDLLQLARTGARCKMQIQDRSPQSRPVASRHQSQTHSDATGPIIVSICNAGTEPFRSRANSLPGANRPIGPWRFRSLAFSFPDHFIPRNFRSLELSLCGSFAPDIGGGRCVEMEVWGTVGAEGGGL